MTGAHRIDRTRPPATPELPPFKLPPIFETRLSNGMEVVLVEDRRFPLVTARLGVQAGSKFEPRDLPGLSDSTAALLTEGTATRSARQVAEEAAAIGGSVRASSSADSLVASGNALAENLPKLVELLSDVARNSVFPDNEVELQKQNRAQELLAQRSHASYLASERFNEVVFGEHPYSRQDPTLESLARMDRAAFAAFRDRHLAPEASVLVLLGALPPRERVLALLESNFGTWARRQPAAPPPAEFPSPRRSVVLVNRPGSVQADIRIGKVGVTRADPNYFPMLIANTLLGGGASSRLFMKIREEKGYAYDAHSELQPMRDAGLFAVVTQVRNEVLGEAVEAVLAEMETIGRESAQVPEIGDAKNYLSGVFVIRLETQDGLAAQLAGTKLMGLPLDYLEKYTARVRAVEPGQLQAAASRYVNPSDASIVVVGDAERIGKELERFGAVAVEEAK